MHADWLFLYPCFYLYSVLLYWLFAHASRSQHDSNVQHFDWVESGPDGGGEGERGQDHCNGAFVRLLMKPPQHVALASLLVLEEC